MKERIKGAFTKRKILHFLKMALFVVALSLILLSLLGTVAHATGLVDDTINAENLYSKYPLSNYQLDFYVDNSWSWLPWNWLDGIGKSVQYGLYCITNFVWTISLYLSNATGYVVQEAYKLDFINDMADSIGKSIQTLAGVTENGFSSTGFYVGFLLLIILVVGMYVAYTGLIKRETSKALHAVINFVVVFVLSASFIAYAPDYIKKINEFSSDISTASLDLGTKIMLPNSDSEGKDSVDLIRDSLFSIQVEQPWLLLQFGNSNTEEIGADRVEALVSASPEDEDGKTREEVVKTEIEDNDNNNLTIPQVVLISADSDDENSNFSSGITGMNLSAEVLKHQPMVEKYARENGISEYVNVLLAIIQVESGGTAEDVMQSSESLGLPPNSLDTESSIKQGCKYFASLLSSCKNQGIDDLNVAIQSYNYGGGYVGYVAGKGKKHTFNLAESFAREKSGGKKVTYTNPIAVAKNGGWRYGYGNMFYVEVVNQYLAVPQVSGELAQKVMNEALKYQGWKYVYGGSNPNTSFDCSGLTQWCYGKAGISLPRTAQAQYDATQHLPLSQAKAGDLVFFHSTYNAGSYVTHVGILVSQTQMYHAGDPIGYADLSSSYWQQHLIGAGRVKQ